MRTLTSAALFVLLTALPLVAAADSSAGPPKPGKKCSIAAEGVGTDAGQPVGVGFAVVAGAALVAARARRARRAQ